MENETGEQQIYGQRPQVVLRGLTHGTIYSNNFCGKYHMGGLDGCRRTLCISDFQWLNSCVVADGASGLSESE